MLCTPLTAPVNLQYSDGVSKNITIRQRDPVRNFILIVSD